MAGINAVVIGAGSISNAWFGPLIEEKVDIAAVVDIDIKAARAKIKEYGLNATASTDLAGTLKKYKPDFVVDLTIPDAHCKVTCAALAAGCHVIGEKPMASSMAEARKMVRAAERAGKMYMVGQSRRWNPLHYSARKTMAGGKIGTVTTVNCDFYIAPHFGGFRDKMESPLILDMAIHHFDLARFFSGADPVAVYAKEFNPKGSWYKGDVAASCIFEMSNGIIFTYRGSWCAEGCNTSWNGDWRFIGDKGTLLYEKDSEPTGQAATGNIAFSRKQKDIKLLKPSLKYREMRGALREMLAFLRKGTTPQTECHDNIQSLAMVFAVIESSRKGRRVPIRAI